MNQNEINYKQGDYTNCYTPIAEIVYVDEDDYDVVCTVAQDDADKMIDIINENLTLKGEDARVELGDYTVCRYDISEIIDADDEDYYDVICTVATRDVDTVLGILEENLKLKGDN